MAAKKLKKQSKLTSKKQSKLKRAIIWFKPTTPQKSLLLFVIVFAVVGGGYALKSSFAASWQQDSSSLRPFKDPYTDAYHGTDTHGSKGTVSVLSVSPAHISCGGGIGTNCLLDPALKIYMAGFDTNFYFNGSWSGPTQICLIARSQVTSGAKGNGVYWALYMNDGTPGGKGTIAIPATTQYAPRCSGWFNIAPGTHNGLLQVRNYNDTEQGGSWLYTAGVALNW